MNHEKPIQQTDMLLIEEVEQPVRREQDLALKNWVTMDAEEFEELWVGLEESLSLTKLVERMPEVKQIEDACSMMSIYCLASGEQDE